MMTYFEMMVVAAMFLVCYAIQGGAIRIAEAVKNGEQK